jgi:hypothetical protein
MVGYPTKITEAYVKRTRTGLLCLALACTAASYAQDAPPQQPAQQQPPTSTEPQTQTPNTRLPPAPPKVIDVRMPGESGWWIGITGWLPVGSTYLDKGKEVSFTAPSYLKYPGTSKGQPGGEIGIAAGLHNTVRLSYMFSKAAGTQIAANDFVAFSQTYYKGDEVSTSYKFSNYKISYEYLTWPYPVENRHFRLKTLWQVQYVTFKSNYDAPIKSSTPDVNGNLTSYAATGSKSYFTPTLGLGFHEYVSRNFRLEFDASGFAWPRSFHLVDLDGSMAYSVGKIELRAGARGFKFRSSAKSDYYNYGTLAGAYVGVRWHFD